MKEQFKINKQWFAIYLIWFFINIVILVMSDGNPEYFYPFQGDYAIMTDSPLLNVYDLSEFLVYAIGPAVLFIVYSLFEKAK